MLHHWIFYTSLKNTLKIFYLHYKHNYIFSIFQIHIIFLNLPYLHTYKHLPITITMDGWIHRLEQFQDILKPNYNSVDLSEVELVDNYDEPRYNHTELRLVRCIYFRMFFQIIII